MRNFDLTTTEPIRDVYICDPESEALLRYALEREKEIYARGRAEGERILSEQLLRQRAEMLELQNGVFDSLTKAIPEVARQCEKMLVELAIEVAQKIVCGLPISADMISAAIRESLKHVGDTSEFTIYLHPEDFEILKRMNGCPEILARENVRILGSEEVSRGGCIVETKFGIIDNRRETKIRIIKESLQSGL